MSTSTNLNYVRQSFEKLNELGESVVGDTTLATEVVVVGGNEAVERQLAVGGRFEEVDEFPREERQLAGQRRTHARDRGGPAVRRRAVRCPAVRRAVVVARLVRLDGPAQVLDAADALVHLYAR